MKKTRKGKCRYCSKQIEITKKGLLKNHLEHKGIMCVGSAQKPRE